MCIVPLLITRQHAIITLTMVIYKLIENFVYHVNSKQLLSIFKYSNKYTQCKQLSSIKQNTHLQILEKNEKNVSQYTDRTYTCGDLRLAHVGEKVILCGWLEYQRLKKFIVLRDGYGETQLIIKENDISLQNLLNSLPYESILQVNGTVVARPKRMINNKQQTGSVEVLVDTLNILNKADEKLPFNLREFQKAKEPLRMQFRYIDLRFPQMQFNLRTRSSMLMKMREFLINEAYFVEIETPTLFKATPGGAQEFVVPTRFPGQFYSLVQSPQQFKQMLMAGAVDRYFQIARCYRDEGSRPDRQPEFTQLDIELSFTNVDGVVKLVEDLLQYSWPNFLGSLPAVFERMTYQNAMESYGTDKPDNRFDFKLQNITQLLQPMNGNSREDFYSACLIVNKDFPYSASIKEKLNTLSKDYPGVKFISSKVKTKDEWIQKMSRALNQDIAVNIYNSYQLNETDVVFLSYGPKIETLSLLGKVRQEYANFLEDKGIEIRKKCMSFLWIMDFPLFELDNITGNLQTVHHPFTSPHPDDLHLLDDSPLKVRSLAYDLVLNGNEVGGGSIRIHSSKLQEKILRLLKIDKTKLQHMLDMLSSGCPPHGGIALGLDRLLATIVRAQSIRDVIAFPKTFEGRDPISGAPSEITETEKRLYHINALEDK